MLKELKKAMRITKDDFDALLANFLMAGASELEGAGVKLPGTVSFTLYDDAVVDTSTLKDPDPKTAVLTYAAAAAERFWNGPSAEKLTESFEMQKGRLMHDHRYTDYGEDEGT